MTDVKAFQEQVKKGDLNAVQLSLHEEPSLLDAVNETGQSSFLLAKYYRQSAVAEYLLSRGPKLSLFDACVAGRSDLVLPEIDNDLTLLESHSSDGWTPLHLAAFFGHEDLAVALLDRGAVVNALSTNALTNTPLHAAVAGGHPQLVDILLKHGADANFCQHGGWTALHGAAQSGNRQMVETLLAHGAAASAKADNNQAPLDLALANGRIEVAQLLEQLGAKLQ